MKPTTFRQRMIWLKRAGYQVLPLSEAVDRLYSRTLPTNAVVITIDDGWYGTYKYMLPVFEELEFPSTLYVYTAPIENRHPLFNIAFQILFDQTNKVELYIDSDVFGQALSFQLDCKNSRMNAALQLWQAVAGWEMCRIREFFLRICDRLDFPGEKFLASRQVDLMTYEEISDASHRGMDIQLHTHNHLTDRDNPSSIRTELRLNREKLAKHVSNELRHFCYPSGNFCDGMFPYLAEEKIVSATTSRSGHNNIHAHPYALSRILDGQRVSQLDIESDLSGFKSIAHDITSFIRR